MTITGFASDIVRMQEENHTNELAKALYDEIVKRLPEELELCYVEYDDKLMDSQIQEMFWGKPEFEIDHLDEWESDSRHAGIEGTIEFHLQLTDEEVELLEAGYDGYWYGSGPQAGKIVGKYTFMDQLREEISERDRSDPFGTLARHTPAKFMRYLVYDGTPIHDDDADVVDEIIKVLGLEFTQEPFATLPKLRSEIEAVLAEAGTGWGVYILWYGDVDKVIDACYRYENGDTITWENPHLLLLNPSSGSGYADVIHAKVTVPFCNTDLYLDTRDGGGGYSFTDEVCGGWCDVDPIEPIIEKRKVAAA